jgi:MFS family permease
MVHMRRAFLRNLPYKGGRCWFVSVPVHRFLQCSGCGPERSHRRHHQVFCKAVGISIMNSSVTLLTNVRTAIFAWTQCGSQVISLLGPAISSTAIARGLWLVATFRLGIVCLVLVIPCVLLLPETRPWIRQITLQRPSHPSKKTIKTSIACQKVVRCYLTIWRQTSQKKMVLMRTVQERIYHYETLHANSLASQSSFPRSEEPYLSQYFIRLVSIDLCSSLTCLSNQSTSYFSTLR